MSFTIDVKNELSRIEPLCTNCAKATLSALVKTQGTLKILGAGKFSVEFDTDNAGIARFALANFREIYNLDAVLTYRRSVLHNSQNYLIELLYGQKLKYALSDMGIVDFTGDGIDSKLCSVEDGIKQEFLNSQCCSAAYLRGAFLGNGYVSEPKGDFHFEISVQNKKLASDMISILSSKKIKAGMCMRRQIVVVYIKSGQGIADFLALTGAHRCAIKMEEVRVKKTIANQINRQNNADIANAKRTIDAALSQVQTIKKVLSYYGKKNLSPALLQYINLRIKYQNATLSELGQYAQPPLSKSAISGRVRRLEKMAKAIDDNS